MNIIISEKINVNDAIMIGDRLLDIETADNAGIASILYDPDNFYYNLNVKNRVSSMVEIINSK